MEAIVAHLDKMTKRHWHIYTKREILFKYLKDFILFPYFAPILHFKNTHTVQTHTKLIITFPGIFM